MTEPRLMLALVMLTVMQFRTVCAQEVEEANPDINYLSEYLGEMSEKLDFYVTFEDRADAEGFLPWIVYIKDVFTPDLEVGTIDDLVANLNEEIPDVTFRRSTKSPSVVHVIAKDLLVEGYVMDEKVSIEYSGIVASLPDQLGALLNGEIQSRLGFLIGESYDVTTEVELDIQNETVRDVLTGAVPLEPTRRFLWESRRREINGETRVEAYYFPPDEDPGAQDNDEQSTNSQALFDDAETARRQRDELGPRLQALFEDGISSGGAEERIASVRAAELLGHLQYAPAIPSLIRHVELPPGPGMPALLPVADALALYGEAAVPNIVEACLEEDSFVIAGGILKGRSLYPMYLAISKGRTFDTARTYARGFAASEPEDAELAEKVRTFIAQLDKLEAEDERERR